MERGVCLASQQLRNLIQHNKIIGLSIAEKQIQPTSFEPTLSNEVYILDTETKGIFRPQRHETVYKTLLELPERQRYKVDITNGFEIKKGFTYLFPLRERVVLNQNEYIKSSTKSSFGRLFLHVRMLADYSASLDEINSFSPLNQELSLWLLVQPLTFNLIVYPGLSFNQLRFFQGYDAQLSSSEVVAEFQNTPLLVHRGNTGSYTPAEPIVTDGLQIHLDLQGRNSHGVVGLRARHNPNPIDLRKLAFYDTEHYFQPIFRDDSPLRIVRGEHYLFASKEIIRIPAHLSAEVKAYSHIGLSGPLHFAGFIDSGFDGDLVFEVRSDELSTMILTDAMPISKIDLFRNIQPDIVYGQNSLGSNYQGQIGVRASKFFKQV